MLGYAQIYSERYSLFTQFICNSLASMLIINASLCIRKVDYCTEKSAAKIVGNSVVVGCSLLRDLYIAGL